MGHDHPSLSADEVLAHGGWHPRYARVLAAASDGDFGFAVIDGNGDGAELEAEAWHWYHGTWHGSSSSAAGALSDLGPLRTGGHIGSAFFAYGTAPRLQSVTVSFDGRLHDVPVGPAGVWAFIKVRTNRADREPPSLQT
jgi:hypothetical protein